jgi:hypothetical protein
VLVKLATQVRETTIIGWLEDNVPRDLDSIQNLNLKPLCKKPPVRKTGAVPYRAELMARNLSGQ